MATGRSEPLELKELCRLFTACFRGVGQWEGGRCCSWWLTYLAATTFGVALPSCRHPRCGEGTCAHQQRGRSENSQHDVGKVDLQNRPCRHQGAFGLTPPCIFPAALWVIDATHWPTRQEFWPKKKKKKMCFDKGFRSNGVCQQHWGGPRSDEVEELLTFFIQNCTILEHILSWQ